MQLQDLNRTCVQTYAAITGEPVERVQADAASQRILPLASDNELVTTNTSGPTVREAAASLLRQRLMPTASSSAGHASSLLRRFTAPQSAPMDLAAYEREAEEMREAALQEKRAHVALLRQQIESERLAAERRIQHTDATARAAKRRHQTRIKAIVSTGDDDPLETDLSRPSPYAANANTPTQDGDGDESANGGEKWKATLHRRPDGLGRFGDGIEDDDGEGGDAGWGTPSQTGGQQDDDDDHDAMYEASLSHVEKRLRLNAEQRAILRTEDGGSPVGSATSPQPRADHPTTKRLAAGVSRAELALQAQREKVAELRNRLIAAGISVSDVAAQAPKRSRSAMSGNSSTGAPQPSVSPSLYPAHFLVGEAAKAQREKWMASQTPGPSVVKLDKIKPLDPVVEKRLYRPPVPFQPPEPLSHDITLRTASLHANKEPILGEVLPPAKVKKPAFTDETVKRMVDNETLRRKKNLEAIEVGIKQKLRSDIDKTRLDCGMAPLKGAGGAAAAAAAPKGEGSSDDAASAMSPNLREHVKHMYDDGLRRIKTAHERLTEAQFERIEKQLFHAPRKLDKAEQKAMAQRLHDASVAATKQAMAKAVEANHADTRKVATHFAKRSMPDDIDATFKRLQEKST